MKIIIVAIGSQGDVNPFIKIGMAFDQRGHDVTLLANEYFKASIQNAGLDFIAAGTVENFRRMRNEVELENPANIIKPILAHLYFPAMQKVYDTISNLFIPGKTVVIGITLAFGAKIAHDKLGVPLVTCHLAPVSFRSSCRPARHAGLWMPHWMPKWYHDIIWRLIDSVADKIMGPPINAIRTGIDLPPVNRIMKTWIHSPDQVVGLFPDWFAEPQDDWPKQTRLTGFVFYDEADTKPMPRTLEKFIAEGEPPVVFTPGTAAGNVGTFFQASLEACKKIQCRAVFLSPCSDQIPQRLLPTVYSCQYAPFSKLLPRSGAIVHHGGIGTCAQALRAGIPQLLVPFGLDQHDNASRIIGLGAGSELALKEYKPAAIADRLKKIIGNKGLYARCRQRVKKMDSRDSIDTICRLVEGMGEGQKINTA